MMLESSVARIAPLRVAFAIVGELMPAWQRDALDAVRGLSGVEISLVSIEREPSRRAKTPFFASVACKLQPPSLVLADSFLGSDLIVNFSGTPLEASPRFGVWSFRLGLDDDGRFPFAREIAARANTVEMALECRRAGKTTILRHARLPASAWYSSTVYRVLGEAALWPTDLIAALRDGVVLPAHEPDPGVAGRNGPSAPAELAVSVAFLKRAVAQLWSECVTDHVWNVGLISGDPRAAVADARLEIDWLRQPPAGTWIADPFLIERDGIRALFVEEYRESVGRGAIKALVLDAENRIVSEHAIIEQPTHLSYPFPLELDGELYLIPENCESNSVRMYRCVRFPDAWEFDSVILDGIDAVDTTLVEVGGLWWAFFTRQSRGRDYALNAMFAPSPRGPWTPHPLNPIVTDVSCARPAGPFFMIDGQLYRPGQDCSNTYGGALAIARVDTLTPQAYRETIVRRISPNARDYPDGLHTISFAASTIAVDGKLTVRSLMPVGRRAFAICKRATSSLRRDVAAGEENSLPTR